MLKEVRTSPIKHILLLLSSFPNAYQSTQHKKLTQFLLLDARFPVARYGKSKIIHWYIKKSTDRKCFNWKPERNMCLCVLVYMSMHMACVCIYPHHTHRGRHTQRDTYAQEWYILILQKIKMKANYCSQGAVHMEEVLVTTCPQLPGNPSCHRYIAMNIVLLTQLVSYIPIFSPW